MLCVSTSWKSPEAETATDILGPMLRAGIRAVELDYRVTEDVFRQMLPALRRDEPVAASVHNFFPVPFMLRREQGGGDAFLLSSLDREERERAVKFTLRTMEFARESGASAVVLHLGVTEMDDEFFRMKEEAERHDSLPQRGRIAELLKERRGLSRKHLDAALFSLDKLWRPAERLALRLGIENRNTLREVPDIEEMECVFKAFEGAPIGYWHDVGHGAVQELLYGIEHEQLLTKFSERLIGIHLHDADGVRDHLAPGKGKVDFNMVRKYVVPSVLRVVEVHSGVSEQELQEGFAFLVEHDLASREELMR